LGGIKPKCVCEGLNGARVGRRPLAAFEVRDAAGAQTCRVRELVLGEAKPQPMLSQQCPEDDRVTIGLFSSIPAAHPHVPRASPDRARS
jgi:hypothetical protein